MQPDLNNIFKWLGACLLVSGLLAVVQLTIARRSTRRIAAIMFRSKLWRRAEANNAVPIARIYRRLVLWFHRSRMARAVAILWGLLMAAAGAALLLRA